MPVEMFLRNFGLHSSVSSGCGSCLNSMEDVHFCGLVCSRPCRVWHASCSQLSVGCGFSVSSVFKAYSALLLGSVLCVLPIGQLEIGDFLSLFSSQRFWFVVQDEIHAMFCSGVSPGGHNQHYGVAFLSSTHSAISLILPTSRGLPFLVLQPESFSSADFLHLHPHPGTSGGNTGGGGREGVWKRGLQHPLETIASGIGDFPQTSGYLWAPCCYCQEIPFPAQPDLEGFFWNTACVDTTSRFPQSRQQDEGQGQ